MILFNSDIDLSGWRVVTDGVMLPILTPLVIGNRLKLIWLKCTQPYDSLGCVSLVLNNEVFCIK